MGGRRVVIVLAVVVALPLVGAPVSMADWEEQAVFTVEPIDATAIDANEPIVQYENLSAAGQAAVRQVVASPDDTHTVYGREDWPGRFRYSEYSAPEKGIYALAYQDDYYRLTTFAGGGFTFMYLVYELPFVFYGVALAAAAVGVRRETVSARVVVPATAFGAGVHVLGPEFDFPVVDPLEFVGVGALGAVVLAGVLLRAYPTTVPEGDQPTGSPGQ